MKPQAQKTELWKLLVALSNCLPGMDWGPILWDQTKLSGGTPGDRPRCIRVHPEQAETTNVPVHVVS